MKKIILIFLLAIPVTFVNVYAQNDLSSDKNDDNNELVGSSFNRWSVELNVGNNKPSRPFTSNLYFTGDPTNFVDIAEFKHYDLGVRYMFNTKFGLKFQANYDIYTNQKGSGSLDFESKMIYGNLEGVANLGQVLNFQSFTKRFGFLAHSGLWVGNFEPTNGYTYPHYSNRGVNEWNGGVVVGLTPQVRISNRIVFNFDLSSYFTFRQHYTWDGTRLQANSYAEGVSNTVSNQNLTGQLYTFTAGLTIYLGSNDQHADWYNESKVVADNSDKLGKRIDDIENRLLDTDRDGVVDYLDTEPNTVTGVTVDTKGRSIDRNNNGVPDELESKAGKDGTDGVTTIEKQDAIKILVERGYVNVFFDVNMDDPNVGSTNNVYQIIHFLRSYPDAKAKLMGYADVRGDESKNQDLSTRRAQKVLDIIAASGVDASRLTIVGNGVDTSYPADTKIGLDLARRVSVVLE